MEIIQYIIDLDIDYFLKLLSKTFKKFEIPPKEIVVEIANFLNAVAECHYAQDFLKAIEEDRKEARAQEMLQTEVCNVII